MTFFTQAVLKAAKENISRGWHHKYKPGWNDHLQQLHDAVCTHRETMEDNPTNENVAAYNKAKAEFNMRKPSPSTWKKTPIQTDLLWQITRTLNDD